MTASNIQLVSSACLQGCPGRHISVAIDQVFAASIKNACGGPYGGSTPIDHRKLPARDRQRVQQVLGQLIAEGRVDREAGERFLDEVFSGPCVVAHQYAAMRSHAHKGSSASPCPSVSVPEAAE